MSDIPIPEGLRAVSQPREFGAHSRIDVEVAHNHRPRTLWRFQPDHPIAHPVELAALSAQVAEAARWSHPNLLGIHQLGVLEGRLWALTDAVDRPLDDDERLLFEESETNVGSDEGDGPTEHATVSQGANGSFGVAPAPLVPPTPRTRRRHASTLVPPDPEPSGGPDEPEDPDTWNPRADVRPNRDWGTAPSATRPDRQKSRINPWFLTNATSVKKMGSTLDY